MMGLPRMLTNALHHFGPAMGRTAPRELARATIGTVMAIMLCDMALWAMRHAFVALPGGTGDPLHEVIIVASFAATAFLIFTVPNSPLAQPWSVIMGNSLGAVAGLVMVALVPFPVLAAVLAVGASVLAMEFARALHPPSAAMALNVVLLSYSGVDVGPVFILSTITAGSVVLVVFGMMFNQMTGRRYPFRQPSEALPAQAAYLADILARLRLSANIGVADLSRLIAAAEAEATAHHLGKKAAEGMMTPAPRSLPPEADLPTMRAAFGQYPFHAIPVAAEGRYLGLLPQMALIDAAPGLVARDLMQQAPVLSPQSGLPEILPRLTSEGHRILAVVDGGQLVGTVTRSDLIGVLARALRHADD